ncbi:MAG: copper amine oxidase N-terminal domain-containing protein [Ruminococcaceae bacterium]|nr:copper amine oxidase N-terminal domain-containing protein [Oscillospiraceae bacterium]
MTKKILSAVLAVMLVISLGVFTVSADDELAFYVEAGATGKGTEDDPFGTIDEAILALNGKDGTIYVYGAFSVDLFNAPAWEGTVTIAGVNTDSILTLVDGKSAVFNGDTIIKDIGFSLGKNCHFNPGNSATLTIDAGEDALFDGFFHLSMYGSQIVDEGNFILESGEIRTLYAAGGYCTSLANGVMGDANIIINGGKAGNINLDADAYMDTQTGISIGGNLNVIHNGGEIGAINVARKNCVPEVMGALNIIFNNGMIAPEKFNYPEETVAGGVFIIHSDEGGMIMPTSDVGVFEVKSNSDDKVAKINGELVYNGTVTLEPGETEVEWVAGQQPVKAEEKTEIKLTIGKAEITTNGEAKALDVPAQIIDSRTMVPLRAIFEALGASVEWDDATKTVTSVKGDTTVKLTIGQASINVNGADKALDVPAQIVDSRTLVPVRAIAESFGCEVGWDDPTKTVTITK